ncbi:MAG: hypothetical protein A2427_02675 [Candidatus Nealsonbacteria bacterium RIFOXYC1_FULL_40_7]|uniref:Uncharacterized protein n=1 Tax=Candidatus Nealsonbacteria bacterium RIFOXYC1_FULL_40_7 TaxID=1801678 RepID=A0A1G2EQK2_9BACT|nr:MAG: hypothetical protein A2427_02675 [Candidatus Nealsonbacteria bacterium RIFOXYC1_FULL_40_7]
MHEFFVDFTNIILIGYDIPELFGDKISKDLYDLCMKIRIKYEDVHKRCFSEEDKITEELEKKYNLRSKTISYLTISEFESFIKNKKLPDDFDLEQREKFFILKYTGNGEEKFTDEDLWKEFQPEMIGDEIKGNTAYLGKATGNVKIIKMFW